MEEAIVSLFAIVFYSLLDCPHNIDGHKTTEWMAHRKRKETKQEPGTAGPGNMFGCCLISFHFMWTILRTSTVEPITYSANFLVVPPWAL